MSISVQPYSDDRLEAMLALFRAETAYEPHIAPLDVELFETLVLRKSYFDPDGLLVASDAGGVVGWIHSCIAPGSEAWHDQTRSIAQIRMLIYGRERLDAGRALVTAATEWLSHSVSAPLLALHAQFGYPFYRGLWMGGEPMGPAGMPHVQLALEAGGYKNTQESIFMVARLDDPPAQPASPGIMLEEQQVAMQHDTQRQSWAGFVPLRTRALIDGAEVGTIGWVIQPHLARLGAPCMNIWSLGVVAEQRRKGIASLLMAHAMRSAHGMDARYASVGTQLWNTPAHAAYARFGFRPYSLLIGRTRD